MEGMSPSQEVSIIFVPLLVAALITSAFAGRLSDRMGGRRKVFVYGSGSVMAVVCASFAFNTSFLGCILLATAFGAACARATPPAKPRRTRRPPTREERAFAETASLATTRYALLMVRADCVCDCAGSGSFLRSASQW